MYDICIVLLLYVWKVTTSRRAFHLVFNVSVILLIKTLYRRPKNVFKNV